MDNDLDFSVYKQQASMLEPSDKAVEAVLVHMRKEMQEGTADFAPSTKRLRKRWAIAACFVIAMTAALYVGLHGESVGQNTAGTTPPSLSEMSADTNEPITCGQAELLLYSEPLLSKNDLDGLSVGSLRFTLLSSTKESASPTSAASIEPGTKTISIQRDGDNGTYALKLPASTARSLKIEEGSKLTDEQSAAIVLLLKNATISFEEDSGATYKLDFSMLSSLNAILPFLEQTDYGYKINLSLISC